MTVGFDSRLWIVLPLLPSRDAWLARLEDAAAASGQVLHDCDATPALSPAPNAVFVTAFADVACASQPDPTRIIGLADQFDVIVPDDATPTDRHHRVQAATESFAQFVTLPPERIIDPTVFAHGPIELTQGMLVSAPDIPVAHTPLSDALTLYVEGRATWKPEIFSWNALHVHNNDDATTIDLTGRPRSLVFGPYVVMPAGRWKAVFNLSFDLEASKYLFRIDWGGVDPFSSLEFRPGRPGVFEVEMTFDWAERGACEFRILVLEGVFNGQMGLSDLQVSRVD